MTITRRDTKPRNLGEILGGMGEAIAAKHRARVEREARSGESYEATERRLRAEDAERDRKAAIDRAIAAATPQRSTSRKAPKGDEQPDFFVPTLYDVGTKDSRSVMDVAVFRLSKRDRRASDVMTFDLPDGTVQVSSGPAGMASVWDYDLVLMAVSHLTEAVNRWKDGRGGRPGRAFRPHVADVLKFLRRSDGGQQKANLVDACKRLNTTHVAIQRTKTKRSGKTVVVSEGEPLISSYKVVTNADTGTPEFLEIEVPKWIYTEIVDGKSPDVLTVHPDYFLIDLGLGRFIYQLARRAAGKTDAKWGFRTLYVRSGSAGEFKEFCRLLRKLIAVNDLPEYTLEEQPGKEGPQLVIKSRVRVVEGG